MNLFALFKWRFISNSTIFHPDFFFYEKQQSNILNKDYKVQRNNEKSSQKQRTTNGISKILKKTYTP